MLRVMVSLVVAVTMLVGALGFTASRSSLAQETLPATPIPQPAEVCPAGSFEDWLDADVKPSGQRDAAVMPAAELAEGEPDPLRELYLVVVTLPPGKCMPYEAAGNQKDGAIVFIVQQGAVTFTAQAYLEAGEPSIQWGTQAGPEGDVVPNADGVYEQALASGDWITFDQRTWFTYENTGDEPAVILKAVWATPYPGVGCSGGCR